MNRTNLNKANCCQAKSAQPDPGKQASMPKSSHKNVDSTFSNQDKKKLRPPDKKNIDAHLNQIRLKEKELKSSNSEIELIRQGMKTLQFDRSSLIEEKKKNNQELKTLREEILAENNNLSRLESGLTYKNEHKINEAIWKLEVQLSCNNFNLREKKKIVAEIDSLKRSKKSLVNYLAQKKQIDELREQQLKKRKENEQYHREISMLITREDEMKYRLNILQTTTENLHFELNDLNEQKKVLRSDHKRREKDHNVMKDAIRKKNRQNYKHKEEEKQEVLHTDNRFPCFSRSRNVRVMHTTEECIQNCNTLIKYLQQFPVADVGQASHEVQTPTEETAAASLGPVSEIQGEHGATYVLLKKNDEGEDYFFSAGRRHKKSKKGQKFSPTKPLTHSQQVFVQFQNLQMSAPASFAEILPTLKQLEEKKKSFENPRREEEEDEEEGLISTSKVQEVSVEQDDVCLSDSGYSADGSAACELSRQVSHTESIDGSTSNISLLEIINSIQVDTVHNDQSSLSSSSSSDDDDDDEEDEEDDDEDDNDEDNDNDILQEVGNGLQKTSDYSNIVASLAQGQPVVARQLSRQHEVGVSELDRKEAALTTDSHFTVAVAAAPLLCKISPANEALSVKLGTSNLKPASVISHNSCTEVMQCCDEQFLKKAIVINITNGGEINCNSSSSRSSRSSSSSSSSSSNDDLSERCSRSSRTLVNVVKSKRVRNFPPTTDISCDLKGMEYEALTSPSGLRFTNRTAPDLSVGCESSSDDEERNANVEPIEGEADEEECEETEPVAAEEEVEEEEDEEEEEEEEVEAEGRKVDELTDNSDSEKDNEKSAVGGDSEYGYDNTDDNDYDDEDNDKKLENEERGLMKDIL